MIPENLKNKIVNTTIDISQYINDEYFSINNNLAYLVKVGKIRMIKVDVTLKKEINTDIYLFNFPTNFLDIINTYFFGNLIDRSGKSYDVAFYNQLESNNFSILIQPQYENPITVESRIIGEWVGFCKSADTDINAEDDKYLNKEEVQALISEALDGAILKETFEKSQSKQDKLIQKLQANAIQESTEEATSLYVEDASNLPAILSAQGNHYQEQQEGTDNLVVLTKGSTTKNGVTVDIENGNIKVNGTNTTTETLIFNIATVVLTKGETYYIKRLGTINGTGLYIYSSEQIWGQATETSFEAKETGIFNVFLTVGTTQINNTTQQFLVSKTSGANWEEGKADMPSLYYPSEIKVIKDEINVVKSNKNLYKITASDNNYSGIKLTINQEEGSATATGTSTGYSHPIGNVTLKPGDYVFSGGPESGDWNKSRLSIYVKKTEGVFEIVTPIYKDTTYSVHLDKETEYRLNYVIPSGTTVTDEKIYPQVEKGTVVTDFVKHEEKEYNLAVQKNMLQNDYFNLDNNKEIHKWGHINTKNVTNLTISLNTSSGNFRRYSVDLKINDRKTGEYLKILCTHFKYKDCRWHEYEGICGWESGQTFCIGTFNKELDTAEKMKNYLLNNDVEIYYELAEQEELALTEEQKETLAQLNTLELFKGVNNIYTEQDLALLQLNYVADTKMYIDNKIASQNKEILNVAGGN